MNAARPVGKGTRLIALFGAVGMVAACGYGGSPASDAPAGHPSELRNGPNRVGTLGRIRHCGDGRNVRVLDRLAGVATR